MTKISIDDKFRGHSYYMELHAYASYLLKCNPRINKILISPGFGKYRIGYVVVDTSIGSNPRTQLIEREFVSFENITRTLDELKFKHKLDKLINE